VYSSVEIALYIVECDPKFNADDGDRPALLQSTVLEIFLRDRIKPQIFVNTVYLPNGIRKMFLQNKDYNVTTTPACSVKYSHRLNKKNIINTV
jgi:hypothetical protein